MPGTIHGMVTLSTYTTNFKWGINLTHMPEFANVGPTQIYLKSEYPLNPPFDHHVPH